MRIILIILFWIPGVLTAQSIKVKGSVRDINESLPLAHIQVFPDSITTVADNKGRFLLNLSSGYKQFTLSYAGYETFQMTLLITRDTLLNFSMVASVSQLEAVTVTSQRDLQTELFESTRMSTNVLNQQDVTSIPVLGGEADLIKVLQLLPGTVRGIEGSSDLFVRGGAADQNLVLLDGVTIYNTSHLLGFVSVFNPDILESVEAINGGFPASYGGRLSSILDVKSKSKINNATHVTGDIGLIASRLYIDQPIVKNKASIWVAGRRTYIDQVMNLLDRDLPYFFYDVNARLSMTPTSKDLVTISYYRGDDNLDLFQDRNNDGVGSRSSFQSGNDNQTIQWNRQVSDQWTSSVTAFRTKYNYDILNEFRGSRIEAISNIEDIGAKLEFGLKGSKENQYTKLGVDWTHHAVSPGVVTSSGTLAEFLSSSTSIGRMSNELAIFGQYEWTPHKRWQINTGFRASMALVKNRTYAIPEPRLSARYSLNDNEAIKLSYSRMAQYIHRISNSAVTSPTDIWYPVTDSVKPQTSNQFSIGWQRILPKSNVMISIETYYKSMNNLIGLEEGTNLFFNSNFQSSLVPGRGRAYGMELLIRKNAGKFTGWISYTLAWSQRQFEAINQGEWFRSRYDRRHNGALVAQYAITPRLSFSLVWEYISGSRFTPIIGQYQVVSPSSTGLDLIPVFAPINSVKLSDAHRLDLGIKFRGKQNRKIKSEWFAGVYNIYNRANPVAIIIETNEATGALQYQQPGLLGLLPFLSYGFRF